MKKLSLIFILSIICTSNIDAQVQSARFQQRAELLVDYVNRSGGNDGDINNYLDAEYTGSPYANDIFLLGNIYENNKLAVSNYALRYNAMTDEIEVKETLYKEDSEIKALTKSPEFYAKIMDDMFVFVPSNETIERAGYFQVLYVGEHCNLYKKVNKKYYQAKKAQNSFEKDVLAKFADKPIYYLVTDGDQFKEFGSSKSKKLKTFGDKQSDIKKFASKGKLDITEEADLIKIVKHYDQISGSGI